MYVRWEGTASAIIGFDPGPGGVMIRSNIFFFDFIGTIGFKLYFYNLSNQLKLFNMEADRLSYTCIQNPGIRSQILHISILMLGTGLPTQNEIPGTI